MSETEKTRLKDRGDDGEEITAEWLKRKGYNIIERNYRRSWGELDVVAVKDNKIHFIEVKTAERPFDPRDPFGPLVRVGPEKQKRFARIITTYILEKRIPETVDWQVDITLVYLDSIERTARVEMLRNVLLNEK